MRHIVGPKGQLVIEKEIRDRLGVQPGWRALQLLVDDHVEIRFVPPEHTRSLAGCLSGYTTQRLETPEALSEARAAAWTEVAKQRTAIEPASEAE
jgi:bifunctional DNA-binding transcriptional regulator/antitoxin component of YhaV-PrlF toxin-antitoxin module